MTIKWPYTFDITHAASMHAILLPDTVRIITLATMATVYLLLRKYGKSRVTPLKATAVAIVAGSLVISLWSDAVFFKFEQDMYSLLHARPEDTIYRNMGQRDNFLLELKPYINANYQIAAPDNYTPDGRYCTRWMSLFLYPPYKTAADAKLIIVYDKSTRYDEVKKEITTTDQIINGVTPVKTVWGASGLYRKHQ